MGGPLRRISRARRKHLISSMTRRSDGVRLRIVQAEPPSPAAQLVSPNLEDAYLYNIHRSEVTA